MIDVAAHFSPEGRAALETIKEFICEAVPLDAVHERALLLAGMPADDIEEGIARFCGELIDCFERERLPERFHVGFVIAARIFFGRNLLSLTQKEPAAHEVWFTR